MFGKPIADATIADLNRLIDDKVAEGQHLEFKSALSAAHGALPWKPGQQLPRDAVNAILEELVAFANASGGVVILGLAETKEKPPRADGICSLPAVAELERRLRDSLNDLIEPRLPYSAVKGIETEANGSGIVLLETQASTLGPHWVKSKRQATIRREDRSDPLSMLEIHDMVLRNSRRFDDVTRKLSSAEREFASEFLLRAGSICKISTMGPPELVEQRIRDASSRDSKWFVGIRATIVAHQPLGLDRLETFEAFTPSGSLSEIFPGAREEKHILPLHQGFDPRKFLGGMISALKGPERFLSLQATRDGAVEFRLVSMLSGENLSIKGFLLPVASALASFDRLRKWSGAPTMPAEIQCEIVSLPGCHPQIGIEFYGTVGEPLPFKTLFPSMTIASPDDIDACLGYLAADFVNAGNLSSQNLPVYALKN